MAAVVLLGPQRLRPTLVDAVARHGVDGPVAAVTAGWEEREDEIDELSQHLARPVRNLRLFARGEDLFRRDPELFLAFGDLLDRRARAHEMYRRRLGHAQAAVRDVLGAGGADERLVADEVASALDAVRDLDEHHVRAVRAMREEFEAEWAPAGRDAVARHRAEVAGILSEAGALAVAGGHVAVLLDRLRLFDVAGAWASRPRPVFAWSGGAMVLASRVVLFHERPPQGEGHTETWDEGLGLARGVLPFPHARRRLRLDDATNVGLMARRFAPLVCLALDEGALVACGPRGALAIDRARELRATGEVAERGAA